MIEVRKTCPAVYRFAKAPWAWMLLRELAEVLELQPEEVWERYFLLGRSALKAGVLPVVVEGDLMDLCKDGSSFKSWIRNGTLYVPAGWARDVIRAAENGIVSVSNVRHARRLHRAGKVSP
jgi:hypothetical protein